MDGQIVKPFKLKKNKKQKNMQNLLKHKKNGQQNNFKMERFLKQNIKL